MKKLFKKFVPLLVVSLLMSPFAFANDTSATNASGSTTETMGGGYEPNK